MIAIASSMVLNSFLYDAIMSESVDIAALSRGNRKLKVCGDHFVLSAFIYQTGPHPFVSSGIKLDHDQRYENSLHGFSNFNDGWRTARMIQFCIGRVSTR